MREGRPSSYKPEYAGQAAKLCALGATEQEVSEFFALMPEEGDWLFACLLLIRQDRTGAQSKLRDDRARQRKARLQASPSRRIRESVRARIWASLKGASDGALFSRLGYSADDLVTHLESRFSPGMSWANYGKWHVDHIRPCASFDLTKSDDFQQCWALANLQPLWAADNVKKGARYAGA